MEIAFEFRPPRFAIELPAILYVIPVSPSSLLASSRPPDNAVDETPLPPELTAAIEDEAELTGRSSPRQLHPWLPRAPYGHFGAKDRRKTRRAGTCHGRPKPVPAIFDLAVATVAPDALPRHRSTRRAPLRRMQQTAPPPVPYGELQANSGELLVAGEVPSH